MRAGVFLHVSTQYAGIAMIYFGGRGRTEEAALDYAEFYRQSINEPVAFWREQARLIDWQAPCSTVHKKTKPPFARWFAGGKTNLCYNAVDRWAATLGKQ